jgi:SnoaL-like domain
VTGSAASSLVYSAADHRARALGRAWSNGIRSVPSRRYDAPMTPVELAAHRYFDAWTEPDRAARAALLEACFAIDGRIVIGEQTIRGRAEVRAAIDALFADPRGLKGRLASVIDAMRGTFRFRAVVEYPDGRPFIELLDAGAVDADGRIAALYTFVGPLAEAKAEPAGTSPTALAVRRYVDVWSERDAGARTALLEACFAVNGRLVGRGRTFQGRAAVSAMVDAALADPRGLTVRVTSVIDDAGAAFRLGSEGGFADGSGSFEALDVGEVDADGRIAVIYAFIGPLADAAPAP